MCDEGEGEGGGGGGGCGGGGGVGGGGGRECTTEKHEPHRKMWGKTLKDTEGK